MFPYCSWRSLANEISDGADDDGVEEADDNGSAKTSFIYLILSDSLIYMFIKKCILKYVLFLFLAGLFDFLGSY